MAQWLLLTLLLLGGCATKERIEAPIKALPQWYTSPPLSDVRALYAVGEGADREAAVADALGQIRSMLGVRVASRFESVSSERQGTVSDYQKETRSEISSVAAALTIAHYEVVEVYEHSFRSVMVLLRSRRADLVAGFEREIEAALEGLEQTMQTPTLEALIALKMRHADFETQFGELLTALSTLKANDSAQRYKERYDAMRARIEHFQEHFSFALSAQDAALSSVVRSALSQKGYRIEAVHPSHTIRLHADYERTQAYGFYIVRARLELQTLDSDAKLLRSNTVALIAQNAQSEGSAMQEIAQKLSQKIEAEGIETLIGWQ
ncbi:MAG: LPP20 family lipoprotein [Campylobacterales bacterium]|nr:LPP20 family lipoprotein [Campylobacterales bacterium]